MRVLVTAASKYGSTEEIATAIADGLGSHGLDVTVAHVDEVEDAGGYDAVVLGSAVYAGRWMRPARSLAASLAALPGGPPLWLFSSGPIGDPPKPEGDPSDVTELDGAPNVHGHAVFAGKLVREGLRFGDRAIVSALHAPDGDFRDWREISAFADEVARDLADA